MNGFHLLSQEFLLNCVICQFTELIRQTWIKTKLKLD